MNIFLFYSTILKLFYGFRDDNLEFISYNVFYYKKNIYYLKQINKYEELLSQNFHCMLVTNIYDSSISFFDNKLFVLYKIEKNNTDMPIDAVLLRNIKLVFNSQINLLKMKEIIIKFEKYITNKNSLNYNCDYFNYLSYNLIKYLDRINVNKISSTFVYKNIYELKNVFDLFIPCNYSYGSLVIMFADYFKYSYFKKGRLIFIDIFNYYNLSYDDALLFWVSICYPTFFTSLFKRKINKYDYDIIVDMLPKYQLYIKAVYYYIKKRYYNIPSIEWLIGS